MASQWSQEEINLLQYLCPNPLLSRDDILGAFPGRSWAALHHMAKKLGTSVGRVRVQRKKSDISILLQDTPISAYWMGFLYADGSVSDKKNTLSLCLEAKDKEQVKKFGNFISYVDEPLYTNSKGKNSYYVRSTNCQVVPVLMERFGLRNRKTYEPPAFLPYTDPTLLRCWLIGFIDGDGTISTREEKVKTPRVYSKIAINIHGSWEPFLRTLSESLCMGNVQTRVSDREPTDFLKKRTVTPMAKLYISKQEDVCSLKRTALKYELPVLARKWNQVPEVFEPMTNKYAEIFSLYAEGVPRAEIARRVGYVGRDSVDSVLSKARRAGTID